MIGQIQSGTSVCALTTTQSLSYIIDCFLHLCLKCEGQGKAAKDYDLSACILASLPHAKETEDPISQPCVQATRVAHVWYVCHHSHLHLWRTSLISNHHPPQQTEHDLKIFLNSAATFHRSELVCPMKPICLLC